MTDALPLLLARIRDGHASDAELAHAREMLGDDLLDGDPRAAAGELLAALDAPWELGEAVRAEADVDPADVVRGVFGALFDTPEPLDATPDADALPWRAAVADEAGDLEIADAVLAALDLADAQWPVRAAVHAASGDGPDVGAALFGGSLLRDAIDAAAGPVDVIDAVSHALGLSAPAASPAEEALPDGWLSGLLDHALPPATRDAALARLRAHPELGADLTALAGVGRQVRLAVEEGAGAAPAVWATVAPAIGIADPEEVPGWDEQRLPAALRAEAGVVDVSAAVLAVITAEARAIPALVDDLDAVEPANGWQAWLSPVLAVAVAALTLIAVLPRWNTPVPVEAAPTTMAMPFAAAGEVNVDELSYGANATVFVEVPSGQDTPLIIWVDDGGGAG